MDTVRYGSRGNSVLLLQLALRREGSFRGELDGIFGTRTLNAVRRFQSAHGLTPDGVAGRRTVEAAEPYLYGFFRYKLKPGDSFYRLAKRFGTEANAVAAANPRLDPAELAVGAQVVIPLTPSVTPSDAPYSSELMGYIAGGLAARYPEIRQETIGTSVLGKPIWAFRLGRGSARLLIAAAFHANEWITAPLTLDFLESMARAAASHGTVAGRSAAELLKRAELIVVPLVDPDGADLVNSAVSKQGFARSLAIAEDFPDVPFPSGWKANIAGIDLNLSFPAGWEEAKRIKSAMGWTRPAPRDYPGRAPLEAPEARAVHDLIEREDPVMLLCFHTQGGEIYLRYNGLEPECSERIGERLAQVSGYEPADTPENSSYAGCRDWFIERFRRPGFTVEAGRGKNPLPLSELARLKEDNFPLMVTALEEAGRLRGQPPRDSAELSF